MEFEDDFPQKYRADQLMAIETHGSLKGVREYLHGLVYTLIECTRAVKGNQNSRLIDHLHRYIDGHLDGDLSLTRMAETANLNASYLSRLYRNITGDTLTQRINTLRIDRACSLLRDTRMQIYDIGCHVGYEIPAHFTRFFKRMTGQTPQEYRSDYNK